MNAVKVQGGRSGVFHHLGQFLRQLPLPVYLVLAYGLGYLTLLGDVFDVVAVLVSAPASVQDMMRTAYVVFALTHIALASLIFIIRRMAPKRAARALSIWTGYKLSVAAAGAFAAIALTVGIVGAPDKRDVRNSEVKRTAELHRAEIEEEIRDELGKSADALRLRVADLFDVDNDALSAEQAFKVFEDRKNRLRLSGRARPDLFVLSMGDRTLTIPELGDPAPSFATKMVSRSNEGVAAWLQATDMGPMIAVSAPFGAGKIIGGELYTKRDFLDAVLRVASSRGFDVAMGDEESKLTVYSTNVSAYGMSLDGTPALAMSLETPIEIYDGGAQLYVYRWAFGDRKLFPTQYLEVSFSELSFPEFSLYSFGTVILVFFVVVLVAAFNHEERHEQEAE